VRCFSPLELDPVSALFLLPSGPTNNFPPPKVSFVSGCRFSLLGIFPHKFLVPIFRLLFFLKVASPVGKCYASWGGCFTQGGFVLPVP